MGPKADVWALGERSKSNRIFPMRCGIILILCDRHAYVWGVCKCICRRRWAPRRNHCEIECERTKERKTLKTAQNIENCDLCWKLVNSSMILDIHHLSRAIFDDGQKHRKKAAFRRDARDIRKVNGHYKTERFIHFRHLDPIDIVRNRCREKRRPKWMWRWLSMSQWRCTII